jgi:hypothetical protein
MASVLSRRPQQPQHLTLDRSAETFRHRARQASKWGLLALVLAAPLLLLAFTANARGFVNPEIAWIDARAHTATTGPGFSHLQFVYPPLPVLLALILPDDQLSLAIVTCLFSGVTLAVLVHRAGFLRTLVLVLPLIFAPAMWYTASQLLPQVVSLTFLALALQGFIRFANYGETYGGFMAGLALAISYAADPGALVYAAVMCLFIPLIGRERYHGDPQAPVGVAAVIAFPCVAMAACWSFLIWKFTGQWPGNLAYAPNAAVLQFPHGVLGGLSLAITSALTDLARTTLYWVVAIVLLLRRGTHVLGLGLALPAAALAVWIWLGFDYSPITAYFLLTLLAITVVTQFRLLEKPRTALIVAAASVLQVIEVNLWAPDSVGYLAWRHLMFH